MKTKKNREPEDRPTTLMRKYRNKKGISLEQVASAIGISRQAVWYYETRQSTPSRKRLYDIARILQLTDEEREAISIDVGRYPDELTQALLIPGVVTMVIDIMIALRDKKNKVSESGVLGNVVLESTAPGARAEEVEKKNDDSHEASDNRTEKKKTGHRLGCICGDE